MITQQSANITTLESYDNCQHIKQDWDSLLSYHNKNIFQHDVTSTFDWARTLWEVFLYKANQKIILLESDNNLSSVLPLYTSTDTRHYFKCRKLAPITELYSGRSGFLLGSKPHVHLETLIDYMYQSLSWDILQITLVDNSDSDILFQDIFRRRAFHCHKLSTQTSPYVVVEGTWQQFFDSLPKKFRWALRNGVKKLREYGNLTHKEYTSKMDSDYFLDAMMRIEKASWKEHSGTSITTNAYQEDFYRQFAHISTHNGWFSGHLLELDGIPIAYIYGIVYNNVFLHLKGSYRDKYKEYSPGHVLNMFIFEQLYKRQIQFYDFMGTCEPYKMKWTDKTYSRSTYIIYNNSLRGIASWIGANIAKYIKHTSAVSPAS